MTVGQFQSNLKSGALDDEEVKRCIEDVSQGKVYTLENISRMLRCSYELTRQIFMDEPGVVNVRNTYRVPDGIEADCQKDDAGRRQN
jgi:hypothetical protein